MSTVKKRFYELDVLRGLAAIAVVFYHYTTRYHEFYPENDMFRGLDFKYGYLGVNLFFIISGFVIYLTINKCESIIEFIYKRGIRLYPAYIVAVILTFSIVSLVGLDGQEVGMTAAIINLSMLSGFLNVPYVDGAYWSLTVELMFYFMVGMLFFWGVIKKVELTSIIWLSIAFITFFLSNVWTNNLLGYVKLIGILEFCHLFIAGIMFYLLKSNHKKSYYAILIFCLTYEFFLDGLMVGLIVTSFFVLFYLIVLGKLHFLNNKLLIFVGTISYSLYLVHQNIGYVVINMLETRNLVHPLWIIIPFGLSILLASFITFYIEKPAQKYMRSKYMVMKEKKEFWRKKAV